MFRRIAHVYVSLSLRRWGLILLLAGLLSIPAFQGTLKLFKNIDTDLAKLLPEDYPSVQLIEQVRDKMDGSGNLWVILEGPQREAILPVLEGLVPVLRAHPDVSEVEFKKPGYDFFDAHKLLYVSLGDLNDIRDRIDRKIQREKLGDLYISFEDEDEPQSFDDLLEKYKGEYSEGIRSPYYESDDGQVFLINVTPKGISSDFAYAQQFYESIQAQVSEFFKTRVPSDIKVYYAGSIRTRTDEYLSLMTDLSRAGWVAGVGILVLLALVLHGIRPILMVLVPLLLGMNFTFGIAGLFIDGFNTVTAFMFAIMMGLGIDFGIHMVSRYLEDCSQGRSQELSLFNVLCHVGHASWTSAVTTATAFFLLLIVDFRGFSEFGLIAGIGIITAFLTYWLLLPAWIKALEFWRPVRRAPTSFLAFLDRFTVYPKPKWILAITGSLTLMSLCLVPWMSFEYDYGRLRAELPNAEEARDMEQRVRQRRPNPAVVILQNEQESDAVDQLIQQKKRQEDSLIDRFASLYSLVPKQQLAKQEVMAQIDELLADETIDKLVKGEDKADIAEFRASLEVENVKLAEIPQTVKDKFMGNKSIPGSLGLIMPVTGIELHDGRLAMQWADEVQNLMTSRGLVQASSDAIIFGNVLRVMLQETRIAVPLAFLGVLLLLIVDLRRWRDVLIVVLPWISGVLWMVAGIVLFGLRLNFYNVFIPAAVFGMGIDYAVHLVHRYRESPGEVIPALQSAGRAIIIAGLTTLLGFSGLAMANHRGLQSMGWLAIIGIGSCMICSLTMLPALLEIGKKQDS